MKKTRFYPTIWSTVPFTPSIMADWYAPQNGSKELIMKNNAATSLKVSEMTLNIVKLAAVDMDGKEHQVVDFPGQNPVVLKGIPSGCFLRSKSLLALPKGKYTALRFYLAGWGNQFIYRDGVEESANTFESLDFAVENGFEIDGNELAEAKLWFDFAPYQWKRHFKPLSDLFKGSKSPKPRLANSFGN